MSNLSTLPKGDSAWLLRRAIERIIQQISVLETNIGSSTTGNSSNGQVIFNDNGTLRGDADMTFNTALNRLIVSSLEVSTTATITGNLTVDTSTFAVDAANNRVFVGTAPVSTAYPLFVTRGGTAGSIAQFTDGTAQTLTIDSAAGGLLVGNANNGYVAFTANGLEQYRIAPLGVFTWADGAGGTRMTLNSTGLGVGVSPDFKFAVNGTQAVPDTTGSSTTNGSLRIGAPGTGLVIDTGVTAAAAVYGWIQARARTDYSSNFNLVLQPNGGNVGIGVTPSAWASIYKTVEFANGSSVWGQTDIPQLSLQTNAFLNSSFQWIYKTTAAASNYRQTAGAHLWFTAPSGTAGTAVTFTQAMTLASNGQLLLGTSSTTGSVDIGMVLNKPSATGFVGNVYQLNSVEKAFTYISSAAGAFRVDTVTGYTINMVSATNGVYLANGGTSWTALSDERFKDIIEPISNAVAKVGSIRSVIGKFKTESEGTRRSFLIAQDVQAVLPEAVDASNPEKLGVSYTEVIPLLVAAIKELAAEVNALKNA